MCFRNLLLNLLQLPLPLGFLEVTLGFRQGEVLIQVVDLLLLRSFLGIDCGRCSLTLGCFFFVLLLLCEQACQLGILTFDSLGVGLLLLAFDRTRGGCSSGGRKISAWRLSDSACL